MRVNMIPTTPVEFYELKGAYVPGQGMTSTWEKITVEFYEILTSVFYVDWQGTFGEQKATFYNSGVKESALVRMAYNPIIYEKIREKQVIVSQNATKIFKRNGIPDKLNPNTWEVFGGINKINNESILMEFNVRRYEGK